MPRNYILKRGKCSEYLPPDCDARKHFWVEAVNNYSNNDAHQMSGVCVFCVCVCVYVYACVRVCMYVLVCVRECVFVYVCAYVRVYVFA